jgi:hypothetical protein
LIERGLGVLMFIYCAWKNLGLLAGGSSVFRMLPPGIFTTSGLRNSADFRVHVAKDKNGWTGSFPLIVSFYTSTWLVLLEPQSAEFVNVLLNHLSVISKITVSV